MALGKDYEKQDCSIARSLEVVGERWSLLIMRDAFIGVRRYSDFLVHLDIPRAVLATRLNALVAAGLLQKRPYQQNPQRFEYTLTDAGLELWPVVYSLASWGARHLTPNGMSRLYVHADCGARLDRFGACPSCRAMVPPEDIEIRPGPAYRELREDPISVRLRRPHRLLTPVTAEDAATT